VRPSLDLSFRSRSRVSRVATAGTFSYVESHPLIMSVPLQIRSINKKDINMIISLKNQGEREGGKEGEKRCSFTKSVLFLS